MKIYNDKQTTLDHLEHSAHMIISLKDIRPILIVQYGTDPDGNIYSGHISN